MALYGLAGVSLFVAVSECCLMCVMCVVYVVMSCGCACDVLCDGAWFVFVCFVCLSGCFV